jgi:colanic acid/amylovoran biosynthesis glycosyltransferase
MYSEGYGGLTTTFIQNEVRYFANEHELYYIFERSDRSIPNVQELSIPFNISPVVRKLRWWMWNLDLACNFRSSSYQKELEKTLDEIQPDIIHCHFGYEALKFLQNTDTKIPILVHFHGYDASQMLSKKSYLKAIKKEFVRLKVSPIAVSNYMRASLENSGMNMAHSYLLRYGIDLSKFEPTIHSEKQSSGTTFLQVSSLAEKKGHEFTIRALAIALESNPGMKDLIQMKFTGDGPQKKQLEALVSALGVSSNVNFVGSKDPDDVVKLLDEADIFIHHSITASNGDKEGIPNAIMEAMAMRLPVLTTYHSGIPELVQHGVNGLLCEEKDIQTLASQIVEIASWKKLEANRQVVDRDYNMDRHNHKLESFYLELFRK